jgi:hypothetical protein
VARLAQGRLNTHSQYKKYILYMNDYVCPPQQSFSRIVRSSSKPLRGRPQPSIQVQLYSCTQLQYYSRNSSLAQRTPQQSRQRRRGGSWLLNTLVKLQDLAVSHAKRGQSHRFVDVTAVLYVDSTNITQTSPWNHGETFAVTHLEVTNIKCQSSLNQDLPITIVIGVLKRRAPPRSPAPAGCACSP